MAAVDREPRLRADAQRNRDRLLEVARAAFTAGQTPTLEAVAREAGVGIGTLYRHYPTREALIEAVYRAERAQLCSRVEPLLAEHEPVTALRTWMDDYADFIATKRGMAETLKAITAEGTVASAHARANINGAVGTLIAAGAREGTLRADVRPDDIVSTLVGIFLATDDREQAGRMLDLLVDGLRAGTSAKRG
ncbi:TetR/AcrR family transcriptional regulator [Streptomyces sp. 110]|uniref:TetR/AcrR family transcriptional regulator n=1 Tax=Streptomyces endocoffeicus TaxID=2898945 RepID=A0ABS1PF61_9ACTN|nr:TetR/AcrR family transcriptional regulator [Streptomyces endocoffeicus]MBL1110924.1 TetR/AcrR family transcriptional regulator [Streptomyces endocoffeicus]